MQYRSLGKSGVQVSVLGIGANRFGNEKVTQAVVDQILGAAYDLGINHIDTADIYTQGHSEEVIGKAIQGRRSRFFIATKVGNPHGEGPNEQGASRANIQNRVDISLRRLESDWIDLYYIHRWDSRTPLEETLRTLDDLVSAGKVRYIGCSNFASYQLAHANLLAELKGWASFSVIQSRYNLLEREAQGEVLPYCRDYGTGFVPYFPLAGGFLTGKYRPGQPAPAGSRGENSSYVQGFMNEPNYATIQRLETWAAEHGHGLAELAIAWLMAQPAVCSVITGVTRLEQLQANAKAADWNLTIAETQEIAAILIGAD